MLTDIVITRNIINLKQGTQDLHLSKRATLVGMREGEEWAFAERPSVQRRCELDVCVHEVNTESRCPEYQSETNPDQN